VGGGGPEHEQCEPERGQRNEDRGGVDQRGRMRPMACPAGIERQAMRLVPAAGSDLQRAATEKEARRAFRVELTNTRSRWSGVCIPDCTVVSPCPAASAHPLQRVRPIRPPRLAHGRERATAVGAACGTSSRRTRAGLGTF
jgi:hypothetical protein